MGYMTKTRKRIVRWTLIVLGSLIVLVALFYGEENWRGKRAWENCKRELEARGAVLDWSKFIPPPVPDDQNVFKAPKMTEWFVRQKGQSTTELYAHLKYTNALPTPLAELTTQKATVFLLWSAQSESDFDLIREALKRPYARMDGDYERAFVSIGQNFVSLRSLAQVLAERAKCYLLLGQPEKAFRELTLLHDLTRLLEGKPIYLVTAMISVAITGLYVDTIADGFRLHAWREPELVSIQKQLQRIDLLPLAAEAFQSERAGIRHILETYTASEIEDLFSSVDPKPNFRQRLKDPKYLLFTFAPRGWVYQNITAMCILEQKAIDSVGDTNQILFPRKTAEQKRELLAVGAHPSPYNFLAATAVPLFFKAAQTIGRNQTAVNEALVACALERYHLAHSEYPETLDALTFQFIEKLPHDIIGGDPLHYRRTEDGKFLLYSVGWNETDDGGQVVLNKDGAEDREKGDWVWQYPIK